MRAKFRMKVRTRIIINRNGPVNETWWKGKDNQEQGPNIWEGEKMEGWTVGGCEFELQLSSAGIATWYDIITHCEN